MATGKTPEKLAAHRIQNRRYYERMVKNKGVCACGELMGSRSTMCAHCARVLGVKAMNSR